MGNDWCPERTISPLHQDPVESQVQQWWIIYNLVYNHSLLILNIKWWCHNLICFSILKYKVWRRQRYGHLGGGSDWERQDVVGKGCGIQETACNSQRPDSFLVGKRPDHFIASKGIYSKISCGGIWSAGTVWGRRWEKCQMKQLDSVNGYGWGGGPAGGH